MTVSIKFCGGCNPKIDRVGVADEIKKCFLGRGMTFGYNNLDADFIVYVSGCSASCATRNADSKKSRIVIAGLSVDSRVVAEDWLCPIELEK